MIDDDEPKAVKLDFTPPKFFIEVLQGVKEALSIQSDNALVLAGGALRDAFYNACVKSPDTPDVKIKDFDIFLSIRETEMFEELFNRPSRENKDKFTNQEIENLGRVKIKELHDSGLFEDIKIIHSPYKFEASVVEAKYKNDTVVQIISSITPFFEYAQRMVNFTSESPFNCISMNGDGDVFCHPEFESHLQNQIYRYDGFYDADHAVERFKKLQKKYPDLRGVLSPYSKVYKDSEEAVMENFILERVDYPFRSSWDDDGLYNAEWIEWADPDWYKGMGFSDDLVRDPRTEPGVIPVIKIP
jgi:hypothetical protein